MLYGSSTKVPRAHWSLFGICSCTSQSIHIPGAHMGRAQSQYIVTAGWKLIDTLTINLRRCYKRGARQEQSWRAGDEEAACSARFVDNKECFAEEKVGGRPSRLKVRPPGRHPAWQRRAAMSKLPRSLLQANAAESPFFERRGATAQARSIQRPRRAATAVPVSRAPTKQAHPCPLLRRGRGGTADK